MSGFFLLCTFLYWYVVHAKEMLFLRGMESILFGEKLQMEKKGTLRDRRKNSVGIRRFIEKNPFSQKLLFVHKPNLSELKNKDGVCYY